jgi:predicted nucleic acid binding AN1-type Zn finger protein
MRRNLFYALLFIAIFVITTVTTAHCQTPGLQHDNPCAPIEYNGRAAKEINPLTGNPCNPKAQNTIKGYFRQKIWYVVAVSISEDNDTPQPEETVEKKTNKKTKEGKRVIQVVSPIYTWRPQAVAKKATFFNENYCDTYIVEDYILHYGWMKRNL